MAITHVRTTAGPDGTTTNATTTALTVPAVGSGNLVVGIFLFGGTNCTCTGVTDDKGNTYTLLDQLKNATDGANGVVFYKENVTNAPTVITATQDVTNWFRRLVVSEYSGVATVSAIDGHTGAIRSPPPAFGANNIVSGNIATTTNGDLIWGVVEDTPGAGTVTYTAGTSPIAFTSRASSVAGGIVNAFLVEEYIQPAAGTIQTTFGQSATTNCIAWIAAFKDASGAASVSPDSPKVAPYRFVPGIQRWRLGHVAAVQTTLPSGAPYTLTADPATFVVGGVAATTRFGHVLVAAGPSSGIGTFDPSATGSGVTLSNGNLTAELTGAVTNNTTKTTTFQSTGKYYYEFTINNALDSSVVGIANTATPLTEYIGQDATHSLGIFNSLWFGATSGTTAAPPFVTGHVYGVAIDRSNALAWGRDLTAGTNWNITVGADPATGTSGAGFGTIAGSICPAVSLLDANDKVTINFGATAYTGTPPSGFGSWVSAAASTFNVTGVTTGLTTGKKLTAVVGAFSVASVGARIVATRRLPAVVGAFSVVGTTTGLRHAYVPLTAVTGTFTVAGTTTRLAFGHVLKAVVGPFSVTGVATGLKFGHVLPAVTGAFTVSGIPAALTYRHNYPIACVVGAFNVAGVATGLLAARRLVATVGTFSVAGTATGLKFGHSLAAVTGTFAVGGVASILRYSHVLKTVVGPFNVAGIATNFLFNHVSKAVVGTFAVNGTATGLARGLKVVAAPGAFTVNGVATTLRATRTVALAPAAFTVNGVAANLVYSNAGLYVLPAVTGAFTVTGVAANFKWIHVLKAVTGTFGVAGTTTGLVTARKAAMAVGTFTVAGVAARLALGRRTVTTVGTFTLNGVAVALRTTRTVALAPGAFTINGVAANLVYSASGHYALPTTVGAFSVAGNASLLTQIHRMLAAPTGFNIVGLPIALREAHRSVTTTGAFVVSGIDATLTRGAAAVSGVKVWTGSGWAIKPVKVWTGSAWAQKPVKTWNGSVWR
jgi:hypothetical protein